MNEVLYACWVAILVLKIVLKAKIFFRGSAPDPVVQHPSLDAPPRRSGGLVAAQSVDVRRDRGTHTEIELREVSHYQAEL